MTQKFNAIVGNDFKYWDFYSLPTSNYGIGTLYRDENDNGKLDKKEAVPLTGMWGSIGKIPPNYPKTNKGDINSKDWLRYYDYGEEGESYTISLTEEEAQSFNLDLLLPKFFKLVDVKGGYDKKKVIKTTLFVNKAYKRTVNLPKLDSYFKSLDPSNPIKISYDAGDLFVTRQDLVFSSFTSTISIKDTSTINALMDVLGGETNKVFGDSTKFSFDLSSTIDGEFILNSNIPLIVARRIVKQKGGGVLDEQSKDVNVTSRASLPSELY